MSRWTWTSANQNPKYTHVDKKKMQTSNPKKKGIFLLVIYMFVDFTSSRSIHI